MSQKNNMPIEQLPIRADKFVEEIDEHLRWRPHERVVKRALRVVDGPVDLSGRNFPDGLTLEHVRFTFPARFNNCRFGGSIEIIACEFSQLADFFNVKIKDKVVLRQSEFGSHSQTDATAVLILEGAQIDGNVILADVKIHGLLCAIRLRLRGDLIFTGCTVEGTSAQGGCVDLTNGEIVGNVNFESDTLSELKEYRQHNPLKRPSYFSNRKIGTDAGLNEDADDSSDDDGNAAGNFCVTMRHCRATEVSLDFAYFNGTVDLIGLGSASLSSTAGWCTPEPENPDGKAEYSAARIKGELQLANAQIGFINLRGIDIANELFLVDGSSSMIIIEDEVKEKDGALYVAPSSIGNVFIVRWHCRGILRLQARNVRGVHNEWRARGIYIRSSQVDRYISLWPGHELARQIWKYCRKHCQTPKCYFLQNNKLIDASSDPELRRQLNRWENRLTVRGMLKIEYSEIRGDLVLTGTDVKPLDNNPASGQLDSGQLDISHCKIEGHVRFSSPVSFLVDMPEEDRTRRLIAGFFVINKSRTSRPPASTETEKDDTQPATFEPMCSCERAELKWLCARNIDLSGLKIGTKPELRIYGSADLRYANVQGSLFTFARLDSRKAAEISENVSDILSASAENRAAESDANAHKEVFEKHCRRSMLCASFGSAIVDAFQICSEHKAQARQLATSAHISGAMNLGHAEIDELRISDASFEDPSSAKAKASEEGIVLDYAKLQKLSCAGQPA